MSGLISWKERMSHRCCSEPSSYLEMIYYIVLSVIRNNTNAVLRRVFRKDFLSIKQIIANTKIQVESCVYLLQSV